jgi:predicted ATP-dependent protease
VSALSGLPADPSTAVVGALAPDGTVEVVGALGDRLRVFHDLLRRAGDTRPRAVVVPAARRRTLMLPSSLVADATAGRFGVYAVSRIDEAVEAPARRRAGGGRRARGRASRRAGTAAV